MAPEPQKKRKIQANWNELFVLEMAEQQMSQIARRGIPFTTTQNKTAIGLRAS